MRDGYCIKMMITTNALVVHLMAGSSVLDINPGQCPKHVCVDVARII